MSSSQMERYVWSSILYYIVTGIASIVILSLTAIGDYLWSFLALSGYIILIISLNAWRLRRHPRSVHQVKLVQGEGERDHSAGPNRTGLPS
ncbi:hypothetical protein FJ423_21035 [Mesorhizobium sp. B2-8-9]|nr:hypothetical protein FJ423_21035 [Mesorhizobium sp. B2-8-9]